jgi:site-specific recombinase XerD
MTTRPPQKEALVPSQRSTSTSLLGLLENVPEESVWLEGHLSPATRRAYRLDVAGFMDFTGARTPAELRRVSRPAVIAWRRSLEDAGLKAATIGRKLAALSSLFAHLVEHQVVRENPCRDVKRPKTNRRQGSTPAFSVAQARALLDAPDLETLQGLRDRAILSVGFQAGPRRSAIVALRVRDLGEDSGYTTLRFRWKGGHEHTVALHQQTALRIRAYLLAAGHGDDQRGPLFRPVIGRPLLTDTGERLTAASPRRHLSDRQIDRLVRRYALGLQIGGKHSAHSMRATFITVALANGASLEDVQAAAGHAKADTTKMYDRRGYNPDRSAALFANY